MSKNLQCPNKLTVFAPLQQEEKPQTVTQFISKFFKTNKNEEPQNSEVKSSSNEGLPSWADESAESGDINVPQIYEVNINEGRSLPNVLKRISTLLALKTNSLQDYADTELKQYWMPDSVSKECYECSEKFTTFRRRHHCRVCGQIFCSQCCNQQIPGKIFGCTGDLRVCTYCCKIVLSYLQSSNFDATLSADLKALQHNLQSKFGEPNIGISDDLSPNKSLSVSESNDCLKRKISVGYQEERFGSDGSSSTYLTNEEKCKALQNSVSLRILFDEICKTTTGLNFSPYKHRMCTYSECFLGSELVDWLICQQKAKNRVQAAALSQALLEGSYIESFTEPSVFIDGYVRYRKSNSFSSNFMQPSPNCEVPNQEEPSWVQQISHDSSNTDSDTDAPLVSLPSSNSYTLDMNVEASSVYLCRPPESPYRLETPEADVQPCKHEETTVVRPSEHRELAPKSGWFHASSLREENGEKEAFERLSEAYKQHEQCLLKQLLAANGLSISWSDILVPLIRQIICVIRPDKNHDAVELDIRNYVQIKKLPGGRKEDTFLVGGIVCSKNVAHREMAVEIDNPRILLLQCSVVYQRTEGRLMSLEPVMMQEHEYLRHVSARIAALKPDVVFVHKNISRLAQDMLRQHKITLVHNVKRSVMERLSRCTEGDLVTAVDAHIGRPNLGTCKKFYLKTFSTEKGGSKTLMFFEGLMVPHLGATVVLRGTSKSELVRVKKVASFLIFTAYNWRLEKSFLMDEYALPPNSRIEFLEDSRESSPQTSKPKVSLDQIIDQERSSAVTSSISSQIPQSLDDNKGLQILKPSENKELKFITHTKPHEPFTDLLQCSEPKKITVESIIDNSDPLHSYSTSTEPQTETLTVEERPFSNNFKEYLDDTILCISPYILFPVPYLETDGGRKCKLRRFFHKDMYYSEQFEGNTKNKWRIVDVEVAKGDGDIKRNFKQLHAFQLAKITNTDDPKVQNMLAHFRACGGQYKKKEILNIAKENEENSKVGERSRLDVLDPMNHQRLAVLFYSFSHESNNAPAFCVNPWVVCMDFYGRNDIPIGCFLEKYCFRSTYACPSKTCTTPMVKHVRRFVHNSGSVTITLNNFQSEFAEENIVMWSWCTKCQSVSPVVPLSADSWSYSFAKYLELRFHGEIFNRRGQSPCTHSLHHDHFHYFGYKNYVASFKYSSINIWEISLPPAVISFTYDLDSLNSDLIEEAKLLAQKGHDVFAFIHEKASEIFLEELEGGVNVKQSLGKEQMSFKQKVEEIQLKLTSPSVEIKEFNEKSLGQSYWKLQDNITRIKAILVELVETWNQHLNEAIRKSDKKKEKNTVAELDSPASEITEKFAVNAVKAGEFEKSKDESIEDSLPTLQLDLSSIADDSIDSKKEVFKREKTVKNILDKLLPSSGQPNIIHSIFPPQEHYTLPTGVYGPVPVLETEPSSIIAYALNSHEYKKSLEDLANKKMCNSNDHSPSPIGKRKNNNERAGLEGEEKGNGLLGFLRNKESVNSPAGVIGQPDMTEVEQNQTTPDKGEDLKNAKNSHIEVQFQDSTCNFFCRIYLADKFASLRGAVLPMGEEAYIRSLSRSIEWQARGGKSGSNFSKTLDNRFILKEVPRGQIQVFLMSASNYFTFMQKCCDTMQPTLLGKIVGIYETIYKNTGNFTLTSYVLVMENLFYNRHVSQKFDLKGSVRNRLVVPDNQEGEIVLLDENLLKMTCDSPLYVLPHSKEVLLAAIQNDTEFLFTQDVMDYSLLVGLDTKNKELVLGIIDYIGTYTWYKRLETFWKKSLLLGGQGKLPTIISPGEYQKRFIEAMHKYFLEVPDHYAGLGKGLDL